MNEAEPVGWRDLRGGELDPCPRQRRLILRGVVEHGEVTPQSQGDRVSRVDLGLDGAVCGGRAQSAYSMPRYWCCAPTEKRT